jgi:hypothetical protein
MDTEIRERHAGGTPRRGGATSRQSAISLRSGRPLSSDGYWAARCRANPVRTCCASPRRTGSGPGGGFEPLFVADHRSRDAPGTDCSAVAKCCYRLTAFRARSSDGFEARSSRIISSPLPGQPGRGMHRHEGPPQDDGGARTSRDRPLADPHLHSRERHQADLRWRSRGVLPQDVLRRGEGYEMGAHRAALGSSIVEDFLRGHGERIHHLAFD